MSSRLASHSTALFRLCRSRVTDRGNGGGVGMRLVGGISFEVSHNSRSTRMKNRACIEMSFETTPLPKRLTTMRTNWQPADAMLSKVSWGGDRSLPSVMFTRHVGTHTM